MLWTEYLATKKDTEIIFKAFGSYEKVCIYYCVCTLVMN